MVLQLTESLFLVRSSGSGEKEWYQVDIDEWDCECPDRQMRGEMCYHIRTVLIKLHYGVVEEV